MVKKVSQLGIAIKELYRVGFRPAVIARRKQVSRQVVNYWLKHEIKTEIKRKTKLEEEEIQSVVKLAENRKTSEKGCKKIAEIINKELKNKGKDIAIGKSIVCNYLKKIK